MKDKRYDIELLRFFAAIGIMIFHGNFYNIRYERVVFPGGWLFVEMFFMITGYFTAEHFLREGGGTKELKESINAPLHLFNIH